MPKYFLKHKRVSLSVAYALVIAVANLTFSAQAQGATPLTLVVAADGSARYTTINDALQALPATGGVIQIHSGAYHEKLTITKPNVMLIGLGSDASKVVITNNDYAGKTNPATGQPFGTVGSYTVSVTGNNFYATNLTIKNTADYEAPNYLNNGQAVALYTDSDRAVFRSVLFLSGQDTMWLDGDKRAYFNNSYVEGTVDYIFGSGKAVFDDCLIKTKINGGLNGETTITAQGKSSPNEDSGFVFINSQLLFDSPYMTNVWLGRPWRPYATTYFINTKMGPEVESKGWIEFVPIQVSQGGTDNLPTSTYREYNSLYPGANNTWAAFDLSQRESTSPLSNASLTAAQVAALAPDVYLAGNDGWVPTSVTFGKKTQQSLPIPGSAVAVPTPPIVTATTAGNGNVQVSWAAQPANPAEQGFTLTATQGATTVGPITLPAFASSGYVSGLANGVPAVVTVREFNAQGSSGPAVSATVMPTAQAPSAPTNIQFNVTSTTATMNFTIKDQGSHPVFGGNVPSAGAYATLYASQADAYAGKAIAGTDAGFGSASWTFNGLQPSTTYWVSLAAYNGAWTPTVITSFTTAH